jgi:CheY-like chemotaxis protein
LVDHRHGELDFRSEPGKGSTFWFKLELDIVKMTQSQSTKNNPKMDQSTSDHTQTKSTLKIEPPQFKAEILLVKDNLISQLVAKTILKKFGTDTVIAENGIEALEHSDFDLLLMDRLEATRQIRQYSGTHTNSDIPVVALTVNNTESDREACFKAGMNEFIDKP